LYSESRVSIHRKKESFGTKISDVCLYRGIYPFFYHGCRPMSKTCERSLIDSKRRSSFLSVFHFSLKRCYSIKIISILFFLTILMPERIFGFLKSFTSAQFRFQIVSISFAFISLFAIRLTSLYVLKSFPLITPYLVHVCLEFILRVLKFLRHVHLPTAAFFLILIQIR
jgi:hypothetical protein